MDARWIKDTWDEMSYNNFYPLSQQERLKNEKSQRFEEEVGFDPNFAHQTTHISNIKYNGINIQSPEYYSELSLIREGVYKQ